MLHDKLSPRLKLLESMSNCYPLSKYRPQIEQYILSHMPNIVGNTPEIIVDRLKKFFPEITKTINEINKF